MPRAGARPSARSVGWPVRMASRWDWTTRSAPPTSCGRCIEFGRRSDRSRSRAARACRATDRSTKTGVVQDPGGRRERPSVSRDPRNGAVGRRPTCAMCRWGVSRLTIGMRCKRMEGSTPSASMRTQALFDNRWSGKNSSTATPWSAVGRRGMVQWAEDSRDSHCSAHPLLRRAAGAPHTRGYSSTDKSIRLSTGEVRVRIPLVSLA